MLVGWLLGVASTMTQSPTQSHYPNNLPLSYIILTTGRGGRIGRTLVSRAGDRGFEPMVESNQ